VLGAGSHSQHNHLPALAELARRQPHTVELVALCDLRREHAESLAAQFGFQRVYTALESLLAAERLDGLIAVTPIPETARLVEQIFQAGIPILMEKPLGATLAEAERVASLVQSTGVPVMVSMNRRFDPALAAGLDWLGERPLVYLRAVMTRHARREDDFITGTGIHLLDTVLAIGGAVQSWQAQVSLVEGVKWVQANLTFTDGVTGWVEILPTAGRIGEQYEVFGPDYHLLVRVGGIDAGEVTAWENGKQVLSVQPAYQEPEFIANGTYAETAAFVAALRGERVFYPTPAQVLDTMKLCHAIEALPAHGD
jgi:predicted dehydrogenase